ncbi:hypothetical protein [Planctomycetes bacterium CA13]
MVDDYIFYLVEERLKAAELELSDDPAKDMIVMLHNHLNHPHAEHKWDDYSYPTAAWWELQFASSESRDELLIGFIFLIELVWYQSPYGEEWKKLASACRDSCPNKGWQRDFAKLEERLSIQASLYGGTIGQEIESNSEKVSPEQLLLSGWRLYQACDHESLAKVIGQLNTKVDANSAIYRSFFTLVHFSRMHIKDSEDQFVSLPRYKYVSSKQPIAFVIQARKEAESEALAELAIAGFPGGSLGRQRWIRFRMAMLLQLQALRTWDVGLWLEGLKTRGESRVELGQHQDLSLVLDGLFDLVVSRGFSSIEKSELLKNRIQLADFTNNEKRAAFVSNLLALPATYWRHVADVLSALSDAIPEEVLSDVAAWSVSVEQNDLISMLWTHSLLGFWKEILPFTSNSTELIESLTPAIVSASRKPGLWEELHNVFVASLANGEISSALLLAETMSSTQCGEHHFVQYRYSVFINAYELRPELRAELLPCLEADARLLGNEFFAKTLQKRTGNDKLADVKQLRKEDLRSALLKQIRDRSDLSGTRVSMIESTYNRIVSFYKWTRSDEELVNALLEAVESHTVLFTDKFDYFLVLSKLITLGPKTQAKRIVKRLLSLLLNGIPGKNFGFEKSGPLTNFTYSGNTKSSLYEVTLIGLQNAVVAGVARDAICNALLEWIPGKCHEFFPELRPRVAKLVFRLILDIAEDKEDLAAILAGHAEALVLVSMPSKPAEVVSVFSQEFLSDDGVARLKKLSPKALWRVTVMKQWVVRLQRMSKHPSPDTRYAVAEAVTRWAEEELEYADAIRPVRDALSKDPRMRVRKAASQSKVS